MLKKIFILIVLLFLNIISFTINNSDRSQIEKMHIRYKEFLISQGDILEKLSSEDKKMVIEQANNSGKKSIESLENQINSSFKFENADDKNLGVVLRSTIIEIYNLAKSIETKGSIYYKNDDAKKIIIKSLEKVSEYYYEGGKEFGNWWNWEIGIPKSLNEIFVISSYIPKNLKDKLLKASYYFQPDPNYSGKSEGNKYSTNPRLRETTGGNRADTSIISLGRGIVTNNIKEIDEAIKAISKLNEEKIKYSDENLEISSDGFYPDGSFIQHISVPYNGTYGAVLLNGLGFFSYIVGDYDKFESDKIFNLIYKNILNGYPWLMINGGINDSVNGRSISRDNTNDLTRAREIIENLAMISYYAPKEYKDKFESLIKKVIIENKYNNQIELVNNRVRKIMLNEIYNNNSIEPLKITGVKIFPFMDRAVQINKNNGKFVLAMHSNRIANYETMNGENLKGWFTGDGMTYLYNNSSNSYVDYWPTLDYYHIPGTTESIKEIEDSSNSLRVQRSTKSFVGGVTNGEMGIVAMDFMSADKKLEAKKSYVLLGDVILALGSDITSTDNNFVHTTVENRILNNFDNYLIEGNKVNLINSKTKDFIQYIEIIGKFNITEEKRSGSYKLIGGKSSSLIEKDYLKIYIDHGINPLKSSYAYILSPMKNDFNEKDIKIDRLDNIHAIRYKNMEFINFYEKGKVNNIEVNDPLSLLMVNNKNNVELYISNPSHNLQKSKIILEGIYLSNDKKINLIYDKNKTIIEFNLNNGDTTKIKLNKNN